MFTYPCKVISWHCVHVSLLSYFSHSVLFFFINSFIASLFLLMPLPHSLPIYLSQTSTIFLYLSLSLAQSLFYSPYRYYFFIVSPYLPLLFSLTFSLFGATSDYTSLYVCDIIPLLPPLLLWYDYHYYCSVFVLIIIIFLLVLLLANMKINILEKSSFQFLIDFYIFLYFLIFNFFILFIFLSPLNT